jgi:hypothetical protein
MKHTKLFLHQVIAQRLTVNQVTYLVIHLSENTTFTFSNPPASGTAYGFTLKIVQDASASGYTVTWPTSVKWPTLDVSAGTGAPVLTSTASAVDQFVFYTHDGGTTWYGFTVGKDLG